MNPSYPAHRDQRDKNNSFVIDYIMNQHVHEMSSLFVMKKLDDHGIFFSDPIHIRRIILLQPSATIPQLQNDESKYIHRVNVTAPTTSRFEAYFARVSQRSVLTFVDDQLSHLNTDAGKFVFSKRIHVLDDQTMNLLKNRRYSVADLDIVLDLYMEDNAGGYFSSNVVSDTIRVRETSQRKSRNEHRMEGEGLRTTSHKNPVAYPAWKRSAQRKSRNEHRMDGEGLRTTSHKNPVAYPVLKRSAQRKSRNEHRMDGEGLRTTSHKNPVAYPVLKRSAQPNFNFQLLPKSFAVAAAAAGGWSATGGSSDASPLSGRPAYTTQWLDMDDDDATGDYSIFYQYQDPVVRMTCEYVVMTLAEYFKINDVLLQTSVEDWFNTLIDREAKQFCSYGKGDVNCCTKVLLDWLTQNIGIHESLLQTLRRELVYQELLIDRDYARLHDVSTKINFNTLFTDPQQHVPPSVNPRSNPLSALLAYLQQIINKIIAKSGRSSNYPPISILEVLDTTNMTWIIRCERFHLEHEPCFHHGLHGSGASDRLLELWGLPNDQYASHVAIHSIAHAIDRLYCGHTHTYAEAGTKEQILGQILGSLTFFTSCKNRRSPKPDGSPWTAEELWDLANNGGLFDEKYGYDDEGHVQPMCKQQKEDHGCDMNLLPTSLRKYNHDLVGRGRQERRTARGYFEQFGEDAIGDRCEVHADSPPMCLLKNRQGAPYWVPYDANHKYPSGCNKDKCKKYTFRHDSL
jgi:hypothetical protein